jgi:hypothetical protein
VIARLFAWLTWWRRRPAPNLDDACSAEIAHAQMIVAPPPPGSFS